MNVIKATAILLLLAFGALLSGCVSNNRNGTSIPWSSPASWENQVPGMGPNTGR